MDLETLFAALAVASAVVGGFAWYLQVVLLRHLQLEHETLWVALGRPDPWLASTQRASRGAVTEIVWGKGNFRPPDDFARVLVRRIRAAVLVSMGLFLLALALFFAGRRAAA